ncbi:MAG: CoA transferase, partial [Proteobacteria bacterium]|nr:CoA transferase [Pseudomonadota bacterium]
MNDAAPNLLDGVRILDLTRVMSGPYCTAMLADLGAEVIKIEMPGFGEEGRHFAPHVQGESTYFALLNRGKQSVTVDLKTPEGIDIVRRLAAISDVLVENFRPGVMQRLGLAPDTLCAANPRLICASISGFGQDGALAQLPAFDLVIQAMSGLMSVTGQKDGPATAVGESLADVCTGMFASWGILAALVERARTGKGRRLEVAMLDSVFAMLLTGLSRRLFTGESRGRVGNRHPETYPVDSFATEDGEIVLVGFSDAIVRNIGRAIGRPELTADPRFADNVARNANESALRGLIADWAAARTTEAALQALRDAGVPSAPVWSFDQLLASGHVQARGVLTQGRHAILGEIPLVQQPVRFAGVRRERDQVSP